MIAIIQAFLSLHDLAPTTFSRLATGDPRFYSDLLKGRRARLSTEQRVRAFMDNYQPPLKTPIANGDRTGHYPTMVAPFTPIEQVAAGKVISAFMEMTMTLPADRSEHWATIESYARLARLSSHPPEKEPTNVQANSDAGTVEEPPQRSTGEV